jgi:four helix bundle protein
VKSESDEHSLCFFLHAHTVSHALCFLKFSPSSSVSLLLSRTVPRTFVFIYRCPKPKSPVLIPPVMFDFENLIVYKKAKTFNTAIREFIKTKNLDRTTTDQLRRAAFSVVLNLAEGSGRFSKPDRRNFFIIARSSVFECVAILDVLKDESMVDEITFRGFYNNGDELSRILFAMIKNLEKKR